MERIGKIELLQIQERSLKAVSAGGEEVYDPSGIVNMSEIRLTTFGIVGRLGFPREDMLFLDVHHLRHPRSRFRGDNKISLGFSSHYAALRAAFGGRVRDGQAGENIVVSCRRTWSPDELGDASVDSIGRGSQIDRAGQCEADPAMRAFRPVFARRGSAVGRRDQGGSSAAGWRHARAITWKIESDAEAVVRLGDVLYRAESDG